MDKVQRKCRNCVEYVKNEMELGRVGACLGVPPTPIVAGVSAAGQAQITSMTPIVAADHPGCSLFKALEDGHDAETH